MAVHAVEMKEIPASKIVPLSVFTQEENIRSTETGTMAMKLSRAKSMLPMSDQIKVPTASDTKLDALLEQIAHMQAMSNEQKAALSTKVQTALSEISKQAEKIYAVLKDVKPKDGTKFDPWNQSIMMAYTAFAETQMNQNSLVMNGWVAQQTAQNNELQDAAQGEADIAKKSTTSQHADASKSLLVGIITAVVLAVVFVAIAAAVIGTGGVAAPGAVIAGALVLGALTGTGIGVGSYVNSESDATKANTAASNGDTSGSSNWFLASGADEGALNTMQTENTFWGMISQKANNQISSGSQTDVVNASSNNTSLGQQASQVIQAMGQAMQTRVNG